MSKFLETIAVRMPGDVEKRKLPSWKGTFQENINMLNETETIRGEVLGDVEGFENKDKTVLDIGKTGIATQLS